MNREFGLSEAIKSLREELYTALYRDSNESIRFAVHPIELTLSLAITKDVNGKLGWSVVGVGGAVKSESVQTLKLTLDAALVSDVPERASRGFTITGNLEPDVVPGQASR